MFVLGMNGAKRSGKDYAADVIINEMHRRGYTIQRTSFAKALRDMTVFVTACERRFIDELKDVPGEFKFNPFMLEVWLNQRGLPHSNMNEWLDAIGHELGLQARNSANRIVVYGDHTKEGSIIQCSGRDLLIILGQAARRIDPDFWVRRLAEELNEVAGANLNLLAVVTDVRPQNEARACDFVLEVQNPGTRFEGTATETRLPEHLRHMSIENRMDASFAHELRRFIPNLCKLVDGKNGDTPAMLDRRQWLNPELYNRAFLEVR